MSESTTVEKSQVAAGAAGNAAAGAKRSGLTAEQVAVASIFTTTGVLHFIIEKFFIAIVPKGLPNPKLLVQASGVAELLGAIGILIPGTRRVAGKGLIALLIAVFPANVNMAINADRFKQIPEWALWARLPLQFAAIGLVWRAAFSRS